VEPGLFSPAFIRSWGEDGRRKAANERAFLSGRRVVGGIGSGEQVAGDQAKERVRNKLPDFKVEFCYRHDKVVSF
jgi:hypothetical protein